MLSWRRLGVLVRHLPRESSLVRAIDPTAAWSTTEYLLATLVDLLAGGNWQRGGGRGQKPKPLPRPGAIDQQSKRVGRTTLPLDEARRRLDRLHGRGHRCPKCGRSCKSPAGLASHRRACEKRKG